MECIIMDDRQVGHSDLRVLALSFGAETFGGYGPLLRATDKMTPVYSRIPYRQQLASPCSILP